MNNPSNAASPTASPSNHQRQECQRLQQQVARDGGTHQLSATDLAFFQTFCKADQDLPQVRDANLRDGSIDESAHLAEGTIFGDPNAGRPDDPADANPAAPDPLITRE